MTMLKVEKRVLVTLTHENTTTLDSRCRTEPSSARQV
jgi:hypothetical protein